MDRLLGEFDCGYLINLPERRDRLRAASAEVAKLGWADRILIRRAYNFDSAAGFESAGARGCFHSHLACLRQLMASSQSGIILEDDICFTPQLPRFEPELVSALRSMQWDLVYFGHEFTGDIERASWKTRSVSLRSHSSDVRALHFYGVRCGILGRLVEFLELLLTREPGDPRGGPMTIDGAFNTFRYQNSDVRTLIAVPKLGWQRPSRSDITPNRWDGIRALRPVLFVARQIKGRIRAAQ